MRERSGRQDVPERSGPNGLARRASAANATTESGAKRRSQAELGCGVGPRRGVYGAVAGRLTAKQRASGHIESRWEGLGEDSLVFRLANASSVEKRNIRGLARKALK